MCSEILTELESLRNKDKKDENKDKEEGKRRIKSDIEDKKNFVQHYRTAHPLKVEQHITKKLVNVYTGEGVSEYVNANESNKVGIQ